METGALLAIATLSAGLWLLSLLVPVVSLEGKPQPGYWLLLIGWLGPLGFQFGWYANPLLWTAWAILANGDVPGPAAGIVGVGLLLTGANALMWDSIATGNGAQKVTKVHAGYYLWFASVIGTGVTLVVLGFASPVPAPAAS